tara:strand:- start:1391 stop:2662 length:1272 start_codon:yes stop_codon:yes gene_type:complete
MALHFDLLKWQKEVLGDKVRFRVVCAGRRAGKSRFAAIIMLLEGLQCPPDAGILYVAPTQGQARVIMWGLINDLGREVIAKSHVNNMEITLINGVVIYIRGADNPETLRGMKLKFAVLDEYADMKPFAWEQVVRAALSDLQGGALFIGTPKGRNHFFDIYQLGDSGEDEEWKSWQFFTADNELIPPKEVEAAARSMSSFAFKQEYLASFDNAGTDTFKEPWLKYGKEPDNGSWFISVDLAGFKDINESSSKKSRLDSTAIAVVKVSDDGKWWVKKIEHGRWDVRETAVRILKNVREFRCQLGIEKGTTYNAVMPYLTDLMRKNNLYSHVHPLSHGNQDKTDRIVWALQGLFEHGRIILNEDNKDDRKSWQYAFLDQYLMFPTKNVHDDMIDALSYISQMSVTVYGKADEEEEEYEVFDIISGI